MDPFMYHGPCTVYHVAERWIRLCVAKDLSNETMLMFYPPPQLKLRSFARKRANFIHGTRYMVHRYILRWFFIRDNRGGERGRNVVSR